MDTDAGFPAGDIRPLVARPVSSRGPWIFAGVLAIAGVGLFAGLQARRAALTSPATAAQSAPDGSMIAAPPALVIPSSPVDAYSDATGTPLATPGLAPIAAPRAIVREAVRPMPVPPAYAPSYQLPPYPQSVPSGPAQVYRGPPASAPVQGAAGQGSGDKDRVEASMFSHPATTVPKGAVIQAVLETALDSTQPGAARAIISSDVYGFDGTKVLIPRGSRLYGEYKANVSSGQNRALIQWQRLMRPDGAMIELDSPSADPLGRAGIKGKVNSHFLARFGGALLQSTLNLGVALASRSATGSTVILGLPGSSQNVTVPGPENVKPTLKVAQGTPVSVFVARDLDFTPVE